MSASPEHVPSTPALPGSPIPPDAANEGVDLRAHTIQRSSAAAFSADLSCVDTALSPEGGLPGIPDIALDVGQLVVTDAHLHHCRALEGHAFRLVPGHAFGEVFERRLQDFSRGERGVSIIGGTQFAPEPGVEAALKNFFAQLFSAMQERDIGIANGGGAGPAMSWTSEIYRQVRESANPDSRGKICQVLCEIEPPNGFGDDDYIVRPQRNVTTRFQMVKALGPWAVIATPGRIGTICEINATLMDNAFRRLQLGQDASVTPIVLLGYGPDQKNEWWDWVDEMFKQMDENIKGAKKKYTISDTIYYVDFKDTAKAVESVLTLVEGKGPKPPFKLDSGSGA